MTFGTNLMRQRNSFGERNLKSKRRFTISVLEFSVYFLTDVCYSLLRENDALKAGLGLQLKRKRSIEERPNLTAKFRHLSIAESSRTRDNDIDVD